jgi:hypothetical protein
MLHTQKGERIVEFLESLTQDQRNEIDRACMNQLFEDWCNAKADEGSLILEAYLMDFASFELQQQYGEFYND